MTKFECRLRRNLNNANSNKTVTPSHRERDDNYAEIIARLAPGWRVINCRQKCQWILQRREGHHRGSWRGIKYFRSRRALIDVCGRLNLLSERSRDALLTTLPAKIDKNGL